MIQSLVNSPGCEFAIRSGGHSFADASNIDGGITIDLGTHMNSCWYDADKQLVSIQPGGKWVDIYATLEPQGIMIAGARSHNVGVGGLLTGGGLSWYIPRVGFCCDQVVNMEVVLADGSIINTNKDQNADLWRALKGAGSGNFGVVTRFDLATIPCDPLWAGRFSADSSTTQQHIAAIHNHTERVQQTPDSSFFTMWHYEPTIEDIMITYYAANTKGQVDAPELKEILEIPTTTGEMTITTMEEFSRVGDLPFGY